MKGGVAPKVPDCFQRLPKKLSLPENSKILAVSVDFQGKSLVHLQFERKFVLSM